MNPDSTFSSVVLPAPVPPLMSALRRARTQCDRKSSIGRVIARRVTRSSAFSRSAGKRRIDSSGPSTASGGTMALTREPSANRASTIGELSSMRRPTPLTMRSMTRSRCLSSWNEVGTRSSMPLRSTNTCLCVLTRMSLTVGSRSSGSSGPSPKTSSINSPSSISRSPRLSGMFSSARISPTSARISPSARDRSAWASASRFSRLSSLRWTFALSSTYCGARRLWPRRRDGWT